MSSPMMDFMSDTYGQSDYLEHYGRLGMKWYQHIYGDVDGRAKYADKLRGKELDKLAKMSASADKRGEKKEKGYQKKAFKAKAKYEQGKMSKEKFTKKINRLMELSDHNADIYAETMRMIHKQTAALMQYTLDDFKQEQRLVNDNYVISTVSSLLAGPFGLCTYAMARNILGAGFVPSEIKSVARTGKTMSKAVSENSNKQRMARIQKRRAAQS